MSCFVVSCHITSHHILSYHVAMIDIPCTRKVHASWFALTWPHNLFLGLFVGLVTEIQFPCIRAIVIKSAKLKVGTLFIITYTGGTIGRYVLKARCCHRLVVHNLSCFNFQCIQHYCH